MIEFNLRRHAATIAISAVLGVPLASLAVAQDQGTQEPGATETAPSPPPAEAAPEAVPADPSSDQTLPEVQVIQEQTKPTPPPVKKAKAAPKKKPAPVVQAAPAPVAEPVVAEEPVQGVPAYSSPGLADEIQMAPLPGSSISLSKVPGGVGRASGADVVRQSTPSAQYALEAQVPGVILTDIQGNELQNQIDYRGFYSSPVPGVAQGLAVYQNGVRINESFGDMVNYDFLPSNAIHDITVVSGNPLFGLNAIGGAAIITMRDGFNFHGTEIDTRFGSHGRAQGSLASGMQYGNWGTFLAIEGIHDDGWRDFSPAKARRLYADLGFKDSEREFHMNFTTAKNDYGVVAAAPVQLLDLGWERTFTSPQTTDNKMAMLQLNGSVKATDTLTISGAAYYRRFKQKHDDGNIAEFEECEGAGWEGTVCASEDGAEFQLTSGGNPIFVDDDEVLGSIDRTHQDADSFGVMLQAVDKRKLFDRPNQFTVGVSYDGGRVKYGANSEVGYIGNKFVVSGTGQFIDGPAPDDDDDEENEYLPRDIKSKNDYLGIYFLNSTDITDQLTLTLGGRYNYAWIDLQDNTGNFGDITSKHDFDRFNPSAGLTYKLYPGLTVYGGYSEANRAPTPAELACADPEDPCLIETFLTDDPPLKQIVSKTWEAGLRGELFSTSGLQKVNWSVGFFHTKSHDDILALPAEEAGRGYFANAGDTQRQGIEVGLNYASPSLTAYVGYSYVKATYEDDNLMPSPNTPASGPRVVDCEDPDDPPSESTCILVQSGDRLPGIPAHRFKAGFNYAITQQWKFGADLVASSSQVFFGDDANLTRRLPGWWRVNLNTSYDITENIQIYGIIYNVFDKRYGVFGNFFETDDASEAGEASGLPDDYFTDARTIMPAAPVAAYGGVKVRF